MCMGLLHTRAIDRGTALHMCALAAFGPGYSDDYRPWHCGHSDRQFGLASPERWVFGPEFGLLDPIRRSPKNFTQKKVHYSDSAL